MKRLFKLGSTDNKTLDDDRIRLGSDSRPRFGSMVPFDWTALISMGLSPTTDSSKPTASAMPNIVRQFEVENSPNRDKLSTKLHKACWTGDLDKVRKCVRKIGVNEQDSELRTPLHLAVARGHKDIIWFLLGMKAMPNPVDSEGNTPLIKAIQTGRIDIVHFLLDRGADPKASNVVGCTGLHLAAKEGFQDMAFALIRKGAVVDAVDQNGCTPLFVAAANGQVEMADTLLRHGASVNVADKHERTSLMLASEVGSVSMVRLFLQHGADVAATSIVGLTALDIARVAGHETCVRLLSAKAPRLDTVVIVPPEFRRASIVDNTTDFEDVDLDSWNDDEEEDEANGAALQLKKKIVRAGLNLSKFLDDGSDRSFSEKSVGSQKSAGSKSSPVIAPVEGHDAATESHETMPIKGQDAVAESLDARCDLPPAPTKPKRAASLESVEPAVEVEIQPSVPSPAALAKKSETSIANKSARDLMAELGLSDVSNFSSSIASSARDDEDTDHDLDSTIDDAIGPKLADEEPAMSPIARNPSYMEAVLASREIEPDDNSFLDEPLKPSSKFEVYVNKSGMADEDAVMRKESVTEVAVETTNGVVIVDQPSRETNDDDVHDSSKGESEKMEDLEPTAPSVDGGTLGRIDTLQGVEEVWLRNPSCAIAIDLGPSSYSQASSETATESNDREDGNVSEGIVRARLAKVDSKEDMLATSDGEPPSIDVLTPAAAATLSWDDVWVRVCGRILVDSSDSTDDATFDEENGFGGGSSTVAVSKDITSSVPSSTEDESTVSPKEDNTYKLLMTKAIADAMPATAVHQLATMVQHLRRAWLKEREQSKDRQEGIVGLQSTVRSMEERAVEARSVLTSRTNRVAELELALESTRTALMVESERNGEILLELQRRRAQLDAADSRYVDEASARQEAELKVRAAELLAEKSQLALVEVQATVRGMEKKAVEARSVLASRTDRVAELEHELESTRADLNAESKRNGEIFQELEKSLAQLDAAELRYSDEASARREAELKVRTAELAAEKSQLALVEAQGSGLDVADAMTQAGGSDIVVMEDNICVQGLLESEVGRCKDQIDDLQSSLRMAEVESEHLKFQLPKLHEEISSLRLQLVTAAADRDDELRQDLESVKQSQTELRGSSAGLIELNTHLETQFKELSTEIRTVVAELVRCQNELKAVKEQAAFAERKAIENEAAREAECRRLFEELESLKRARAVAVMTSVPPSPPERLQITVEEQKKALEENPKVDLDCEAAGGATGECFRLRCPCSDCKSLQSRQRVGPVGSAEAVRNEDANKAPISNRIDARRCDSSRVFWNELRNDLGLQDSEEGYLDDGPLRLCSRCNLPQKSNVDVADHRNCIDRDQVELMKQRVELQAREEMNRKLSQINDILEERSKSRFSVDQRLRNRSEPRGIEYLGAIRELQDEVTRLHRSLEHREMSHVSLEQHCARLCDLMDAKRCVKSKLKRRDELDDVIRDVAEDVRDRGGFYRQVVRPFTPMYGVRKYPTDVLHSTAFLPSPPPTTFQYYNDDIRGADDRPDFGASKFRAELFERNNEPILEHGKPSSMNYDMPIPEKLASDYAAPVHF